MEAEIGALHLCKPRDIKDGWYHQKLERGKEGFRGNTSLPIP